MDLKGSTGALGERGSMGVTGGRVSECGEGGWGVMVVMVVGSSQPRARLIYIEQMDALSTGKAFTAAEAHPWR